MWPLWGLVFARAAGVFALAPPMGWRHFPVSLRLGVSAILAASLAFSGLPAQAMAVSAPEYAAAVLREAAVGLVLGLALWLTLWAAFSAGHMQDLVAGFVPLDDEEGPLASLFHVLAAVFFVQLNGLHRLISLFHHSYSILPAGQPVPVLANAQWVYWPALLFVAMLQLAAPVVLAVLLAAGIVASLQRTLPVLAGAGVMPSARAVVALLALAIVAPLLGAVFLQQVHGAAELVTAWLGRFRA